jgi:hypothetical protein
MINECHVADGYWTPFDNHESDDDLSKLGCWRENIKIWRKLVVETLELELASVRHLTRTQPPDMLEDLARNFQRVLRKLEELREQIDHSYKRNAAKLQLAATHQSLTESKGPEVVPSAFELA